MKQVALIRGRPTLSSLSQEHAEYDGEGGGGQWPLYAFYKC